MPDTLEEAARKPPNPAEVPEKATHLIGNRIGTLRAKEIELQAERAALEAQIKKAEAWYVPPPLVPTKQVVEFGHTSLMHERQFQRRERENRQANVRALRQREIADNATYAAGFRSTQTKYCDMVFGNSTSHLEQLRDKCTVSAKKTLENTQAKYVAIAETNKHIHEERMAESERNKAVIETTNKELDEYLQNKRVQRQESSRKLAELKTQQAEQTRLQNRIDFLLHRKLNKQHREQTRSEAEQLEEEQEQLRVKLNDMYEEQRNRKAHLQNLALGGNATFAL